MNFSLHTNKPVEVHPSIDATHSDPRHVRAFPNSPTPFAEKLYRGLTSPIRLLPDFLIIGTQKGGTTSLYNYLQDHPSIASASRKEVHYFDRRLNLKKGLIWYRGHFPTRLEKYYAHHLQKKTFVTGEATPEYLFLPHIPQKAAKVVPHVKLIVLLRNPIDRAYSQYQHAVVDGYETRSFEEAFISQAARIAEERVTILQDTDYERNAFMQNNYLMRSLYIDQLQRWMRLFPREQFLILKSEEFYADPAVALNQVLDFLNVPASELHGRKNEYQPYNYNQYAMLDMAVRKRLIAFFEPHNACLYDFLGIDFGWDK
jgi:Sulfotransferase domain